LIFIWGTGAAEIFLVTLAPPGSICDLFEALLALTSTVLMVVLVVTFVDVNVVDV